MGEKQREQCYICDTPLHTYNLRSVELPPPDSRTRDHVPPGGLFPSPKPSNLIALPCCFRCNNQHSGFDERLRIVASSPFDRNQSGEKILADKVLGGTLAKGRQGQFVGNLLASMRAIAERPGLMRVQMEAQEFHEGMIRITKGLLFTLHPGFNYHKSKFNVIDIHPSPFDKQLRLMAMLKQSEYFERGQQVFQCWRHVDETHGVGAWMLIFYECFGFFVFHTQGTELDSLESVQHGPTRADE